MQSSKIILGQEYAVEPVSGSAFGLRVIEMHTIRSGSETANYAVGYRLDREPGDNTLTKVKVKHLTMLFSEHAALVEQHRIRQAEHKAKEEHREALQKQAIEMLAEAIGARAITWSRWGSTPDGEEKYNGDEPAVCADSMGVELNEHAIPALIAFLARVTLSSIEHDPVLRAYAASDAVLLSRVEADKGDSWEEREALTSMPREVGK